MRRRARLLGAALLLGLASLAQGGLYDPLDVPDREPEILDLAVDDEERDREIPIRVYLPPGETAAPVLLFSHGLGGSREGSAYLGEHWSARGYVAVFLQHPGSDESVWRDVPPVRRLRAMRRAANARNYMLRARDVPATLDRLEAWSADADHPLAGRLDTARVGMSGHSFGALTTQAVSGQRTLGGLISLTDPRIDAAVIMSPSSPRRGSPERAFADVSLPWLLMTGTEDVAAIGNADLESRLAVFPALPPGDKYEVVLEGGQHSAFTERPLPGDRGDRDPNHHRVILALSTAFWDAYLRSDEAARAWLDGDGPRTIMAPGDRWRKK